MRTFCRDLSNTFPNVVRINRGKLSLDEVAEKALEHEAEKVIVIGKWRRNSAKMQFFRTGENALDAIPPMICVRSVKLRRDFEEKTPEKRKMKSIAIAASKNSSPETERLENVLSEFFDIPVLPLNEIRNKGIDAAMQISADPSDLMIIAFKLIPDLVEIGPRIGVSHLVWELNQ